MGMSASQSRMLFLTSRLSDLELRAQQLSNTKMRLATKQTEASNQYLTALNGSGDSFESNCVDKAVITKNSDGDYTVTMTIGGTTTTAKAISITNFTSESLSTGATKTFYRMSTSFSGDTFNYNEFVTSDGTIPTGDGKWSSTNPLEGKDIDSKYDNYITKKKVAYDSKMQKIAAEEKIYDMELNNIDTEHNATQTEMESVKSVVEKNVERTFKIFG